MHEKYCTGAGYVNATKRLELEVCSPNRWRGRHRRPPPPPPSSRKRSMMPCTCGGRGDMLTLRRDQRADVHVKLLMRDLTDKPWWWFGAVSFHRDNARPQPKVNPLVTNQTYPSHT